MRELIDIRDRHEYKMGHLNNAINIPKDLLELSPERYLGKNKLYILYCEKGIYSKELSNKLNRMGYYTKSLDGGYERYKSYL